jgi:opacity protein-like surface antigen
VIWRSDASIAVAVVNVGTVLELTGRSERWYEVIIPESLGGRGDRGMIAVSQVKLLEGSNPPPARALRGSPPPAQIPRPAPPARQPAVSAPTVALRGFGQVGLMAFTARQSFAAVLGEAYGPTFGAGVQLRFRPGLYVQGSIERFRKTGQRVFVFEDTTFPLGIPNTMTIQPITVTTGYRFPVRGSILPYIGAGIGTYLLKEVSPYDEPGERVDERRAGYQAHGGVEFRAHRWLAPAVEAQYTTVPDALGTNGASAAFEEHDLGGWQVQVKVLIGR